MCNILGGPTNARRRSHPERSATHGQTRILTPVDERRVKDPIRWNELVTPSTAMMSIRSHIIKPRPVQELPHWLHHSPTSVVLPRLPAQWMIRTEWQSIRNRLGLPNQLRQYVKDGSIPQFALWVLKTSIFSRLYADALIKVPSPVKKATSSALVD